MTIPRQVFIDSDHSKTSVGQNSPGPVYEVKSSLGRQLESNKESPTYVSFGSAKRFGKAREVKQLPSKMFPALLLSVCLCQEPGCTAKGKTAQKKSLQCDEKAQQWVNAGGKMTENCNSKPSDGWVEKGSLVDPFVIPTGS